MKNIFRILMAVAVLFTASCAKEDISSSIAGGEANVTFTVDLPELGTRANTYGNGANADILYYNVFDAATDELLENISGSVPGSKAFTVNIPMLKGMTYDIVFWAQKNTSDYYKLEGKELTVKYDVNKNANDNDRDAFYAYVAGFDPTKAKSNDTQISLYRPFAQLNAAVVNSDIEAVGRNEVNLTTSTVQVTTYTKFNLATGDVDKASETVVTFDEADMPYEAGETLKDGYKYLSMNYLLVPKAGMVSNVTFTFNNDKNIDFGTSYDNVPLKQNYRTNILGALLTKPTEFNVEIEADFATAENTIFTAFKEGGEVTLTEDITIAEPLVVAAGVKAVLNLNRHNIINTTASEEFGKGEGIIAYGDLTINGTGTVQGTTMAVWARGNNGAKVTINGGTYKGCAEGFAKGGRSVIYASSGNTINIYGGTFESLAADKTSYANKTEGVYAAVNVADNNGYINIYGGTFYKQNPAAPGTEPAAWNTAHPNGFVAEGYKAVEKYNGFYVVPQIVADLYNVTTATTVEFTENLNVATGATIHTQGATAAITIDGKGKSVVSSANSADDFQWENGQFPAMSTILSSQHGEMVTVSNLTFEGTMSALMLGHYVSNTNSDWYNTELNNVNVVNTKVVSFSSNIAPAVCVYGQATLNNCNVYGTTLSELDTDPMWPVYDIAVVNGAVLTLNKSKVGSIIAWAKSKIIVEAGSVVESIKPIHTSMNINANYGVVVKKDATVKVLDLTNIAQPAKKINITIEDGATIGKVVANGVEYPSVKAYLDTTPVKTADELVAALANRNEVVVAAGSYTFPSSDVKAGAVIRCEEGTVFTGTSSLDIKGASVIGATFSNPNGNVVGGTINGTFKNCKFTGSNALRYTNAGETVVFENCVFDGSTYGIHFDDGANEVIFRYCTISGFNALGAALTLVTFENCTFVGNGKSGYNGANLWGSAKLINCEFTFNGTTATEWIDCIGADKTYEFTNCTVNGVAYTAENHADYNIFSRNDATVKINGVDCQF